MVGGFLTGVIMIEISYANVMNGLNKGLNMRLVCHTRQEASWLFHRVCDLWHIENFTQASRHSLALVYGPSKLQIQCVSISGMRPDNLRGFRGVFMIHPKLRDDGHFFSLNEMVQEMDHHNERYLDQWRA